MDDINWWVWALIALAVIALIAIIGITLRNRARVKKVQRDRFRADELREEAEVSAVEASRREADAASARAEAEQAKVAADQLERQAREHEQHAGEVRADASERFAKADEIDPDLDDDNVANRSTTSDGRVIDRDGNSDGPGDDGRTGERLSDQPPAGEHVRDTRRDIP
jgi:uncharacterized membrane protein YcjF (UPF0283 family)